MTSSSNLCRPTKKEKKKQDTEINRQNLKSILIKSEMLQKSLNIVINYLNGNKSNLNGKSKKTNHKTIKIFLNK